MNSMEKYIVENYQGEILAKFDNREEAMAFAVKHHWLEHGSVDWREHYAILISEN